MLGQQPLKGLKWRTIYSPFKH